MEKNDKFVTYFRVSTQRQGRSGLGIEAQQTSVAAYLAGIPQSVVVGAFTDIESGKNNERPQLERALAKCRLTGSILIIAKLDRLSRNKAFLFKLMDSRQRFVCCDMPEANELTLSFMALIADHEGKAISERTKAALQAAKARGVILGNIDNLTNRCTVAARAAKISKAEARNIEIIGVIDQIKAEFGAMSLRKIAEKLNESGYCTSRGSKWQGTSVKRVVDMFEQQRAAKAA